MKWSTYNFIDYPFFIQMDIFYPEHKTGKTSLLSEVEGQRAKQFLEGITLNDILTLACQPSLA